MYIFSDFDAVERRVRRVVPNKDQAAKYLQKVQNYLKTHNNSDDLTTQDTRFLYRNVDFGDERPLSKKKKVDINWTDHSEYRSELRDVDPKKVNDMVEERMKDVKNPKKKLEFKKPGVGTAVVDYDITKNPGEADVVTVWSSKIAKILRIASLVDRKVLNA